jgi:hypothetical protein
MTTSIYKFNKDRVKAIHMVIYKCRLRYVRCLLYFCLFLNPDREIVTSFFKGKIYFFIRYWLYYFSVNNTIDFRVYCASYFERNLMNECYFERYLLNIYDLLIFKKINIFEIFFYGSSNGRRPNYFIFVTSRPLTMLVFFVVLQFLSLEIRPSRDG